MPRNTKKPRLMSEDRAVKITGQDYYCLFCGNSEDDEFRLGSKYKMKSIVVHYYCMLFSSGLEQRGEDDQGIEGFLERDILEEVKRGRKLKCSYCRKVGATIGCTTNKCRRTFHFACGVSQNSLHQYFGDFRSFCVEHRPMQIKRVASVEEEDINCPICLSEVENNPSYHTLQAPCCKRSWFHRECIQRQAHSAGMFFFKCPWCNNKEEFQKEMTQFGIYVPEQDASWELAPGAFQDLYERRFDCASSNCRCPYGRRYSTQTTQWKVLICYSCGSQGIHDACRSNPYPRSRWECSLCQHVSQSVKSTARKRKLSRTDELDKVKPKTPDNPKDQKNPRKLRSSAQVKPVYETRRHSKRILLNSNGSDTEKEVLEKITPLIIMDNNNNKENEVATSSSATAASQVKAKLAKADQPDTSRGTSVKNNKNTKTVTSKTPRRKKKVTETSPQRIQLSILHFFNISGSK